MKPKIFGGGAGVIGFEADKEMDRLFFYVC